MFSDAPVVCLWCVSIDLMRAHRGVMCLFSCSGLPIAQEVQGAVSKAVAGTAGVQIALMPGRSGSLEVRVGKPVKQAGEAFQKTPFGDSKDNEVVYSKLTGGTAWSHATQNKDDIAAKCAQWIAAHP